MNIEAQINVIKKLLEKQLPVNEDGTHNNKYYSLSGKLKQLNKQLETLKWKEYEAK